MTYQYHSQISSLEKEAANLGRSIAYETRKAADIITKINRAQAALLSTKSPSTLKSKSQEIERLTKDQAAVKKRIADIEGRKADKLKTLRSYQTRQAQQDERESKKQADAQRKLMQEREVHERRISSELRSRPLSTAVIAIQDTLTNPYDFFISHASEDKEDFVRELAELLRANGTRVWYDEFTLRIGDSLRREVDRGLANSRYGIVVLSESFFAKEWPQRELDGLFTLELQEYTRILPIWHKISKDEVAKHSPLLADKVALNTSLKSIEEIVRKLVRLVSD